MTTSTRDRILEQAAEARTQGVRSPGDRPSQRRSGQDAASLPVVRAHADRLELRDAADGSGLLHFVGHASVYDAAYEMWDMFGPYTEQVSSGAGALTLSRADLDVPLVLSHDSMRRIARTTNDTLSLSEDEVGLAVDAPKLDPADHDVAYVAPKLRAELIDEMSFKFIIEKGSWSPDWLEFHIEQYDIHRGDVAIVGYGANPHTAGAGLRNQMPPLSELSDARLKQLERDLTAEHTRRGAAAGPAKRSRIDALADLVNRTI